MNPRCFALNFVKKKNTPIKAPLLASLYLYMPVYFTTRPRFASYISRPCIKLNFAGLLLSALSFIN